MTNDSGFFVIVKEYWRTKEILLICIGGNGFICYTRLRKTLNMELEKLTLQVAEIARAAGKFIRTEGENFDPAKVEYKGHNDMVSYVDKTAEQIIVDGLLPLIPDAGFITEEKVIVKEGKEYKWIVDPLDGTTNFIHGLPTFSVSIALQHGTDLIMGVVYEVNRDECFYAWKNGGAYLNGNKIQVSANNTFGKALIATGFPYYDFDLLEKYIAVFRELTKVCHGVRRIGSAAVDLAYVACGRFDAYFEYNLNSYDIAAGMVLVREAGGLAANFKMEDDNFASREILAGTTELCGLMSGLIKKHFFGSE